MMRKQRGTQLLLIVLVGLSGCQLADDAGRAAASTVDDLARQIAQNRGGTSDDAARWLRSVGSTEDEAIRLGQGILQSSSTVSTAEARVAAWIDDAIGALTPEQRAQVRGVALASTCDALDAMAQGQSPDLGSMVLNGLGSLSPFVDQQLLRTQLNDMLANLEPGRESTLAARTEILFACILLDA
jgi:hypothetical protein